MSAPRHTRHFLPRNDTCLSPTVLSQTLDKKNTSHYRISFRKCQSTNRISKFSLKFTYENKNIKISIHRNFSAAENRRQLLPHRMEYHKDHGRFTIVVNSLPRMGTATTSVLNRVKGRIGLNGLLKPLKITE